MSNWVRHLVMLFTLLIVGAVAWSDHRAGRQTDTIVLSIPAATFVALYVRKGRRGDDESDEEE